MTNSSLNVNELKYIIDRRTKLLTKDEEKYLTRLYKDANIQSARDTLVTSNVGLVIKIAKSYLWSGIPIEDIFQEGIIGLLSAINKFNPDLDYKLSTYSSWWIHSKIQMYVMKNWSLVKFGTTSNERIVFSSFGDIRKIEDPDKRKQKIQDLVNDVHTKDPSTVRRVTVVGLEHAESRYYARDVSLHTPLAEVLDEDASLWIDHIIDGSENQESEYIYEFSQHQFRYHISEGLKRLNPRERFIIQKRYLNETSCTLRSLGEELGITRERVRQIESKAIKHLENYLRESNELIQELLAA